MLDNWSQNIWDQLLTIFRCSIRNIWSINYKDHCLLSYLEQVITTLYSSVNKKTVILKMLVNWSQNIWDQLMTNFCYIIRFIWSIKIKVHCLLSCPVFNLEQFFTTLYSPVAEKSSYGKCWIIGLKIFETNY